MTIKPLIPLGMAAFSGFLNLFGMSPFFVDIAAETGTSVSMVGYTVTAALLVTAISGLIVGPIAERVGIRRMLVAGLVLAAGGAVATALAANIGSLALARVLAGVGGAITGGVTIAAAALIYEGRQRQRALAIITASAAMAVVIGIFLMTLMAGPYGWRGAYAILSGALLAVAMLNQVMLAPDRLEHHALRLRPADFVRAYRPLLGDAHLRRLFSGATLHPAVLNGTTAYSGAFLITQHNVSTELVGLVFSLIGATYFVGNLIAGNLGTAPQHAVFSFGLLFMGGFWLAGYVIPASPLAIALLFGVATFAGGLAWVTLLNTVADRASKQLGTAMVFCSALLNFGAAIGTALAAGLLDVTGYGGLAIGMATLAVIGAVAGWIGPAATPDHRLASDTPGRGTHQAQREYRSGSP